MTNVIGLFTVCLAINGLRTTVGQRRTIHSIPSLRSNTIRVSVPVPPQPRIRHVSVGSRYVVKSPSHPATSTTPSPSFCFSGDSTVYVETPHLIPPPKCSTGSTACGRPLLPLQGLLFQENGKLTAEQQLKINHVDSVKLDRGACLDQNALESCNRTNRYHQFAGKVASASGRSRIQKHLLPFTERRLSDVQRGDKLLAMTKSGDLTFSQVRFQMHDKNERTEPIIVISTSLGFNLRLTTDHLVFRAPCMIRNFSYARSLPASKLKLGDCVYVSQSVDGFHTPDVDVVTKISRSVSVGLYAPVTSTGTVVVNKIVASCYAYVQDHEPAHALFEILRYLPRRSDKYLEMMFQSMTPDEISEWLTNTKDKVDLSDSELRFQYSGSN